VAASTPLITFTADVEDYAPPGEALRAPDVIDQLLEFLAARSIRGTFFVVGELAASMSSAVRAIAAGGHEIGLHGWQHRPLPEIEAATLLADLRRGRDTLEQLAQQPVIGFRAPMFSLVPDAHAALDALVESGFTYSSSVLPARSMLWGDPTAPRHPFRWPNGLHELPCPIATFAGLANPYLGGAYLRVLPHAFVRFGLARSSPEEILWLYCHPYDLDAGEPFRPRPELGRFSRLMWLGRSRMLRKIDKVLAGRSAPPLRERLAAAN
jgi:polysaccharide deacetylase family protein (PEP-CTERM system associated)